MEPNKQSLYEQLLTRTAPESKVPPPRPSAAVIPWRRHKDNQLEVYWVRRSPTMRFMGGWHAFPGGGLSQSDADVCLEDPPSGTTASTFSAAEPESDALSRQQLGPDLPSGLAACAIRELFEETGLLLAREALNRSTAPKVEHLVAARQRLLAKQSRFTDLAIEHLWTLTAKPLVFAGRWLTPPLSPIRFDNRFFLLRWDREHLIQPTMMGSELDHGEWIRPADAVERWQRGEVLIAPPILHILRVLADVSPEDGLERLRQPDEANLGPMRRIEFRPGVILLPLRTPTLPPATHTNTYLMGLRRTVLIDPGTPHPEEIERLRCATQAAIAQDRTITAIWLTHHHPDHVGAAEFMRSELGVPICAHRSTAESLQLRGMSVDQELRDNQMIDLGGDHAFPVRIIHTPGHAKGHLCFFDETHRSMIAGDLLSTLSTIVIDPPEGNMNAYLASLDRVRKLRPSVLFPSHGPAVLRGEATLEKLKRHRLEREEQVLAAWLDGVRVPSTMVKKIYPDLPSEIHPVAERQLVAHLERLRLFGRLTDEASEL